MGRRVRSLAEALPGQVVTVRRILFDGLREQCDVLGLHEGDRLRLGGRDGDALVVRRGQGGAVRCAEGLARFVEVETVQH